MAMGNFRGWRILANISCPIVPISKDIDIKKLNNIITLYHYFNPNYFKVFWSDKYLVVTNLCKGDKIIILVYDIQNDPKFLYSVEKHKNFQFYKAFIKLCSFLLLMF